MDFSEFVGQVQHRLELSGEGEAVRAARATLTTLGERLQAGEADDLASSLPMEIDRFLREAESGQRFGYDEFIDRVSEREGVDRADAVYHAKVVVGLVGEVTQVTEMRQVENQLPADFGDLFELVEAD
ncbi:MAG: DUF2267 domain-containing protein [Haloferacaceae archaeon]